MLEITRFFTLQAVYTLDGGLLHEYTLIQFGDGSAIGWQAAAWIQERPYGFIQLVFSGWVGARCQPLSLHGKICPQRYLIIALFFPSKSHQ